MNSPRSAERKKLSSDGTTWWRSIFPPLWAGGVGIGMLGLWMEWWGQPAPFHLKIAGVGIWAITSLLFTLFGRSLHDVWLEADRLVVRNEGRDIPIPLTHVTGLSETRGQKIKSIKIKLRPGSVLGSSVRFVPPLRFQAPFGEHPMVREIKDRKQRIAGSEKTGQLHG